ncbi:MAG: hypothetical protein ACR2IK_05675 [Chloroflexota bacterium]
MAILRFLVNTDVADDPEASTRVEWTAAQIRERLPQFAALFPDGCDDAFPSLTYSADVYRYRISPLAGDFIAEENAERDAAEQAAPPPAAPVAMEFPYDLPF